MTVKIGLNIAGSVVGFVAATVWFCAAWKAPQSGEPGVAFYDVVPNPNFAKAWKAATRLNKWAAALTGVSVLLLSFAALAQNDAAGRAKFAEQVAFLRLASQPCASALDASARTHWPGELLALFSQVKPPITDEEIAAKEKEVQGFRSQLGDAKWCELYAVEMREAHLIFSMVTNRQ
jgi:hypothetical protein